MWKQEPYSLIGKQVKDAWRDGSHPSTPVGQAIRAAARFQKIEGIYLCEYSSGDFDQSRCTGELKRSWSYAGQEFEEVEMPEKIDQPSAIWTPTPIVSFYYSELKEEFIITWFVGGRAGGGHKYRIVEDYGYRTLEPYGNGWRA